MASTVWRGYISFGLISIPVRLFRAARAERISLRRLHRQPATQGSSAEDGDDAEAGERPPALFRSSSNSVTPAALKQASETSRPSGSPQAGLSLVAPAATQPTEPVLTPVKQVSVRSGTDEVVSEKSLVKGFEYEKNRFVAIEPEELTSAVPKTSAAMEIQEFVKLAEIDPVYFETSYYLTPEEAGEKAYALLFRSMQLSGLVAIAQFAMHSREHVVVVRAGNSGLLAHTMFFASEVRADEEYSARVSEVSGKELELAQTLIQSLTAAFEPEKYHDTYREKIQAIIDSKLKGQPVEAAPAISRQAEVVDIADALRRSLANLKKPATSQQSLPAEGRVPNAKGSPRTKRAARGS